MRDVVGFPFPDTLWARYLKDRELTDKTASELAPGPLNSSLRNWDGTPKQPRYYQQVAINRAVQAIARGDKQAPARARDGNWQDVRRRPDRRETVE